MDSISYKDLLRALLECDREYWLCPGDKPETFNLSEVGTTFFQLLNEPAEVILEFLQSQPSQTLPPEAIECKCLGSLPAVFCSGRWVASFVNREFAELFATVGVELSDSDDEIECEISDSPEEILDQCDPRRQGV